MKLGDPGGLSPLAQAVENGEAKGLIKALAEDGFDKLEASEVIIATRVLIAARELLDYTRREAVREERERLRMQIAAVCGRIEGAASGLSGRSAEILLMTFKRQLDSLIKGGEGADA